MPYKRLAGYALEMRPHEVNILKGLPGNDIFLYDTSERTAGRYSDPSTGNSVGYYFRISLGIKGTVRFCGRWIADMVKSRLKRKAHGSGL